jgi:hypothetical protein
MTSNRPRPTPAVYSHDTAQSDTEPRQAGRGTVIAATAVAVLILTMYAINTEWAFLAGTAVVVAVHNYDRRVRPGQTEVPLIAYVVGIYLLGVITLAVAGVVLAGVALSLP